MMKKLLLTTGLIVALLLPFAAPAAAQSSEGAKAACAAVGAASGGSGCSTTSGTDLNSTIKTVVNILSIIVGIIAVIMIIVGGLKFITSTGDSNNVNSARNTILYAVIGLVVVALAQIIVKFVLSKVAIKS